MENSRNQTGIRKNESKLAELFLLQLQDIYWAEQRLVKTLPKMAEAAHSNELIEAFNGHLQETKGHVTRLERVFQAIGEEAEATKCHAMVGIIDEGEELIDRTAEGSAQRDAGLIFAGQKAEHYEIATYGGLVQLARTLGYENEARLLEQTLDEEKKADALLTSIATSGVNKWASQEAIEQ
jgi:ferritin-like metal-binding protein YciE